MVYEVLYERVADITAVDWKAAAEKWAMWFAEKCEAEFLVEQSAKRLKLSAYRARMWQEGVTTKPAAPEDFGLYAHAPVADKPVLVALEALEGVQLCGDLPEEVVSKRPACLSSHATGEKQRGAYLKVGIPVS